MAMKSYKSNLAGVIGPVTDPLADVTALAALTLNVEGSLTAAIALFIATTTVAANIATLVSDGALPTQAHVNTLNTNWGTFLTAYNLAKTALDGALVEAIAANVAANASKANVNASAFFSVVSTATMNEVLAVLRAFEFQLRSTM